MTKVWDDDLTNEEREIPDMTLSVIKPENLNKSYTVIFHGNGMKFADGTSENTIVYNGKGQIVSGIFKYVSNSIATTWCIDAEGKDKLEINEDGSLTVDFLNNYQGDNIINLYAKETTFEIKGYTGNYQKEYNDFNYLIPDTVTSVIFTDEKMPDSADLIDVDADGDGGVVAWTEENNTVMRVSTQIPGVKVQAAKNSGSMFYERRKLTDLDLSGLDTKNVTNMNSMFSGCSGLTSLDLSSFNTQKVTSMYNMFSRCTGLISLDLSNFDTQNVTSMSGMFAMGSKYNDYNPENSLMSLNLSNFNTQNVTTMASMFDYCNNLTNLNLSSFNTQNVTNMEDMFSECSGLTCLDLSGFDTHNVTDMDWMFNDCFGLTSLDLSNFNTQNVTNMGYMFYGCSSLTSLDLSPLNTQKVTNMRNIFNRCSGLTSLDLSSLNTQKVTDMSYMFYGCSGLTSIKTGADFKFVGTSYSLSGTWQNTAGDTFTTGTFPSNVADTYTKISD